MIRRADIEESEINLAMNAWQKEKAKISTGQQCWASGDRQNRWYDVDKLTMPGSTNLNFSFSGAQQKFCVKEMKEKCVTFCFYKLKAKVSLKLLIVGDFSVLKLGLFFQS